MPPTWLQVLAVVALVAGGLSALVIAADILAGRRQPMAVMNLVWPISGLYFGPLAVWAYGRFGRPAARSTASADTASPAQAAHHSPAGDHRAQAHGGEQPHEAHDPGMGAPKPFWARVLVSTSHCGAGCSVGDVTGEWAIFLFGWTIAGSALLTAYVADFALAYVLGIAFQYFAIVPMRGLGPWEGLKAAAQADTLSLIAFEVGMFAWMALTRLVLFHPPSSPRRRSTGS